MPWTELRRDLLPETTTVRTAEDGRPYACMRVRVVEREDETGMMRERETYAPSVIYSGTQAAKLGLVLALEVAHLALREIEAALVMMEAKRKR